MANRVTLVEPGTGLQKTSAEKLFKQAHLDEDPYPEQDIVQAVLATLDEGVPYTKNLILRGTTFQRKVWDALKTIPLGKTISYKQLAERIGNPNAVRAVGTACKVNPLPVIFPCHRVVGPKNPDAYRWGAEAKKKLLEREHLAANPMSVELS